MLSFPCYHIGSICMYVLICRHENDVLCACYWVQVIAGDNILLRSVSNERFLSAHQQSGESDIAKVWGFR